MILVLDYFISETLYLKLSVLIILSVFISPLNTLFFYEFLTQLSHDQLSSLLLISYKIIYINSTAKRTGEKHKDMLLRITDN